MLLLYFSSAPSSVYFSLTASRYDNVLDIKTTIQKGQIIPDLTSTDHLNLIFNGKPLEDHRDLKFYGISSNSTVQYTLDHAHYKQLIAKRSPIEPQTHSWPPSSSQTNFSLDQNDEDRHDSEDVESWFSYDEYNAYGEEASNGSRG
ncbi:uncharacterized protein LOC108868677 [Pyrus x bretschneideri]|uniref:uncharacterized protein LOC108868677 n=1 Tax=Pyrus x bretschneideri TaxID=225117 RepID=UPI0008709034|nr:uncharacterized protein LOC108868677 [Pyrus x bretschneideri]